MKTMNSNEKHEAQFRRRTIVVSHGVMSMMRTMQSERQWLGLLVGIVDYARYVEKLNNATGTPFLNGKMLNI
jgi:hypothetical protein